MESVAVVGAGISGLLAAYYISRKSPHSLVNVYEARSYIGKTHCTGLISTETLSRIPSAKECVLGRYSSVKIFIPEIKTSVDIVFKNRGFVRIDRVELEKKLHSELLSIGVDVFCGNPVYSLSFTNRKWLIHSKLRGTRSYDLLVLASGYNRKLAEAAGLRFKADILSGVQVELEAESKLPIGGDSVLTVLSRYFGGGFAWVVPSGDRRVVIGCATDSKVMESFKCLNTALALVAKMSGGFRVLTKPYGGVVLRGYPITSYSDKAMGLGDCVAMVKSVSGGGLYAISIASKLAPVFASGEHYLLNSLKILSRELRRHYYIAKAISAFLRVAEAAGLRRKHLEVVAEGVNYDDHQLLLLKILANRDVFAELVKTKSIDIKSK
ncbi:MAG: NAD(P)/FAD-dependent oxidoreductase [Sulfolobales archaeon]|nr:NAD(P)/FAD-dependent oxidoreductase [Sulfolobales archaeon]MDW8083175.1 NAD(P)/FAD-dependent oxidoreductase [Sulfolobales archaeon]